MSTSPSTGRARAGERSSRSTLSPTAGSCARSRSATGSRSPTSTTTATVVYTTGPFDEPSGQFYNNTLYAARLGEEPQVIAQHAFGATISHGRIAWLHDKTGSSQGQEVWTTAPGEPAHRLGVPNTGWQGAYWVDAGDGLVVWSEHSMTDDEHQRLAVASEESRTQF